MSDEILRCKLQNRRCRKHGSVPRHHCIAGRRGREAEYRNWNEQWENEGFEPIVIDGRCIIHDTKHPAGDKAPDSPTLDITIEARQAFGTGTHETTRMIVGELLKMDLKGKRILDCGCGTGILGIVASKCGASEIVAYDIDEWSVENARHNAKLNGVKNMEVLEGDRNVLSHVSGVFDVVLANINRNILRFLRYRRFHDCRESRVAGPRADGDRRQQQMVHAGLQRIGMAIPRIP